MEDDGEETDITAVKTPDKSPPPVKAPEASTSSSPEPKKAPSKNLVSWLKDAIRTPARVTRSGRRY